MEPRSKGSRRVVATMVLVLAVLGTSVLPAAAFDPPYNPTFPDVPKTHPFYTQIEWLVAENITTGFSDGTFRPSAPLTRQAIAAFIYRYDQGTKIPKPCNSAPFTDVPKTHPFCGQIQWAKLNGVVQGYPDGSFRPANTVARQGLVVFLYRLAGSPNGPNPGCASKPFTDVPVNHEFCGEIRWAKQTGIVKGYSDGSFKPTAPVARQAFASNLYNYDDLFGVSAMTALGADVGDDGASGEAGEQGEGSSPAADLPSGGDTGTGEPGSDGGGAGSGATEGASTAVVRGGDGVTLPVTGSDAASIAVIGILLIGGGSLLLVGTRRRRSRSAGG